MTASNGLTCKDFVEIVTDYLEGTMPAEERIRFEMHLGSCGACTTYLKQMRQTIQAVGRLSEDHISPEAQSTLLHAFRNWKKY
jgi:anti-sigma factor RsiW